MDDLLPIGSVIQLKNKKKYMIIGFLPSKPVDEVLYDYICCDYKVGIRHRKENLKYNQDLLYVKKEDIINVFFLGYQNKEFDLFQECYSNVVRKVTESKNKMEEMNHEMLQKMYVDALDNVIQNGSENNEK